MEERAARGISLGTGDYVSGRGRAGFEIFGKGGGCRTGNPFFSTLMRGDVAYNRSRRKRLDAFRLSTGEGRRHASSLARPPSVHPAEEGNASSEV